MTRSTEDWLNDGTCSLLSSGGSTSAQVFFYRFPSEDSLEEVAKGKNTTASTPDGAYCPPGKAVDGFLAEYGYYSGLLVKPWWQVDLGEVRLIYQIQIYPRQILYTRFHDVEVRVGTTFISNGIFSAYSFLCSYTKVYELAEGYLLCSRYNGVIGRYVSIQITAAAAEYLQLMEVKVFVLKKTASP
ncbi:fucolectin-5-like [Macrobrachium rosenbergii]|uniref:fucolectin-5-like n=1 Tax=Macrobrachium rosenbergii TaxID=79674 RepID=UPI0034D758B0